MSEYPIQHPRHLNANLRLASIRDDAQAEIGRLTYRMTRLHPNKAATLVRSDSAETTRNGYDGKVGEH